MRRRRRGFRPAPSKGRLPLVLLLVLAGGLGFTVTSAYTAGNSVPSTNIGQFTHTIDANALEPVACSSVLGSTLTSIVTISSGGSYNPSGMSNTLVLASNGAETIKSSAGSGNCVITGAGSDSINLKAVSNQVCIASAAALASQKGCTTTVQSP